MSAGLTPELLAREKRLRARGRRKVVGTALDHKLVQGRVLRDVVRERDRQDARFGARRVQSADRWNTILGEERGEVERAINDRDPDNLREELVQVAAVAVMMVEAYDVGNLEV